MQNICFAIDSLSGGGAERVISDLANSYARDGHSVCIITFSDIEPNEYFIEKSITRIPLGLKVQSSNVVEALAINLERLLKLRIAISECSASVIVSFMSRMNISILIAARGLKIRTIVCERNRASETAGGYVWETLRRKTYLWADRVIVQTEWSREWFYKNTRVTQISVIPNYVHWPMKDSLPEVDLSYLSNAQVILSVGRDSPQKGFERLLNIFSLVLKNNPSVKLVIVGPEPNSKLKKIAEEMGIAESVILPGRVGNMSEAYSLSTVFALSSYYEGFPNVLLEAMSFGIPAVSFDIETGPSEIIDHDHNGFIVKNGDNERYSLCVSALLNDDILYKRLACSALDVKEKYNKDQIMNLWSDELLAN